MDNIYNKIKTELNSLPVEERNEILKKLRDEIDAIDQQVVKLLSKRTLHSVLIGRVKRSMNLPTYNPNREKEISIRISSYVEEPLSKEAVIRIYERIIDESRAIQREESDKGNIFNVSANKMKVGFKNLLSRKEFFLVLIVFAAALALLYYTFFTPNHYDRPAPVKFEISKGESLDNIINDLYEKGIIPNKINMRIAAFVMGAEKKIPAARFYIPNNLSYLDLIDFLLNTNADYLKEVKVYDGASSRWLASRLQWKVFIDSASFYNITHNKDFADSIGIEAASLEGYLLPGKYEFYERSSPKEIAEKFIDSFKTFMVDSLKKRAENMGYSMHEILTIASIVDGETNKTSEMPTIAGVYYNRLRLGMRLQADPTVQFLQPDGWKRLLYKDLKIDSPYNTYKYAGLPPGPINNPGKNAILAALYPDNNKYIYFVADGKGGHNFAATYSEHLRLVKEYRKWLNSQKKK